MDLDSESMQMLVMETILSDPAKHQRTTAVASVPGARPLSGFEDSLGNVLPTAANPDKSFTQLFAGHRIAS